MVEFKGIILCLLAALFFSACGDQNVGSSIGTMVSNADELKSAISEASPGTTITMANKEWKDIEIVFRGNGTENKPIVLKAETPGKVIITGKSTLKFGGSYLEVHGLHFKDGYTPTKSVIDFRINEDTVAHYCRLTECVIQDFNQPKRDRQDLWVTLYGRHNQVDHCYISGKSNQGPTLRVSIAGNESIYNYHNIVNNHFGPRPRKGGPKAETIQLGDSYTSMSPSYTNVSNNYFEKCNGEVEVISSKTNHNEFRNNVFYKCEGSLVTRHGNYCIIDGNYFIGDETSNVGGVRLINTGHRVTNNYFYSLRGTGFLSPLAVMNGIPKSPLNRYNQVTDVVVAYNTWINCDQPWHFGIGSNVEMKDVLPLSEIRSAIPIRTTVANNIVYNDRDATDPIVAHDKLKGIKFRKNIFYSDKVTLPDTSSFLSKSFTVNAEHDFLHFPQISDLDVEGYNGFEFDKIKNDILGNDRPDHTGIGCFTSIPSVIPDIMNVDNYGPSWFDATPASVNGVKHMAEGQDLNALIAKAASGDTIVLVNKEYQVSNSLIIDKALTFMAKSGAVIKYTGAENTPLFEMRPRADLDIDAVSFMGNGSNMLFATLKKDMSSLYNLDVTNCEISNFDYVLKAYKESFADHISFVGATIENCSNGIELSEEINDKGDYNVEYLTIKNCTFSNVDQNVIDYYRGGYDESTIGGNLSVVGCTFTGSGAKEKNGLLLNHRGIINVNIANNTFSNNRVKNIAILWGAKNNTETNNTVVNSGPIKVVENLKQTLMY